MSALPIIVAFAVGVGVGLLVARWLGASKQKASEDIAQMVLKEAEARFGNLSFQALQQTSDQVMKSARELMEGQRQSTVQDLEKQKAILGERLERLDKELNAATELMKGLEKDRATKFGELAKGLSHLNEQAGHLADGTGKLNALLSSSQSRGQWGERMAEDVLRAAGLIDGVNYVSQATLSGDGGRPDFTFLLPSNRTLNMDVKFPLDNYRCYLDAEDAGAKERHLAQFLRDVKARIKELTKREYIQPGVTLDFVLLFIPNEGIFRFVMEKDSALFDDAMSKKVVLCSPFSLYALLTIVRQSLDTFTLHEKSAEVLKLIGEFRKQWEKFLDKLETVGKRIDAAQKEFATLTSTRRNQLERSLRKIDEVQPMLLDAGVDPAGEGGEE